MVSTNRGDGDNRGGGGPRSGGGPGGPRSDRGPGGPGGPGGPRRDGGGPRGDRGPGGPGGPRRDGGPGGPGGPRSDRGPGGPRRDGGSGGPGGPRSGGGPRRDGGGGSRSDRGPGGPGGPRRDGGPGGSRGGRGERRSRRDETEDSGLVERVVKIRRVSKVVKGGRHLTFNAMVVVGDAAGNVGTGLGKAGAVPDAVRKGTAVARKDMHPIKLKEATIPHEMVAKYGAAKVMLMPAAPGTGIIAGGGVRAVMEAAGVKDVLSKTYGSNNTINIVKATMKALGQMRDPATEIRRRRNFVATPTPEVTIPAAVATQAS